LVNLNGISTQTRFARRNHFKPCHQAGRSIHRRHRGRCGHSGEILKRLDESGTLIGLDQDEFAIKTSQEKLAQINSKAKIILVNTNFVNIKEVCQKNNIESVDGILLDLGVSSHQLDEASRGFSYNKDAPLDMRMDRRGELTAKKIVNEYGREEIKRIIRDYGEEKWRQGLRSLL